MNDNQDQSDAFVRGLIEGDDEICTQFWTDYARRLSRLANHRLPDGLRRRIEPEDIVQSACRTFFCRVQGNQLELLDQDMLWPLLCAITINKVRQQIRFQCRQRRDPNREVRADDQSDQRQTAENLFVDGELSPHDAAMFAEQMEKVLATLSEQECEVVEMKLQGCNHQEIADKLLCSQRTVRRLVSRIRQALRDSLIKSHQAE